MADVGGVTDLAHLAVADQVDSGVDLVLHAITNRLADHPVVLLPVDRLAPVLGEDKIDGRPRARQAADVRRENACLLGHLIAPKS